MSAVMINGTRFQVAESAALHSSARQGERMEFLSGLFANLQKFKMKTTGAPELDREIKRRIGDWLAPEPTPDPVRHPRFE